MSTQATSPSPGPPNTAISVIAAALEKVELTPAQQDELAGHWLAGTRDERLLIARLYPTYFHNAAFIQRVHLCASHQRAQQQQAVGDSQRAASPMLSAAADGGGEAAAATPTLPKPLNHAERRLRHAIDSAVPKLSADGGPHPIRFGVVATHQDNLKAIAVYSREFTHPEPAGLKQIVTVPKRLTTRTRRNPVGNFTWFLWCIPTNEICCLVTVTVHTAGATRFVEMPLFATAAGYKKLGLGRLLNAALQEYCVTCGAQFILVSADQNAVPFWMNPSMGYSAISTEDRKRVEFTYKTECNQFADSVLLTWKPPSRYRLAPGSLIEPALARTSRVALDGPAVLPLP